MALDVEAIHRALADQIRRRSAADVNVYAFPEAAGQVPMVEVWPDSPWIGYWGTFGPNGKADVLVRLRIEVAAQESESEFVTLARMVSVGTGLSWSVPDAVMADRTLGGVVDDAVTLSASWEVDQSGALVCWIPVAIIASKTGAQA